jgi:hypothetical protein
MSQSAIKHSTDLTIGTYQLMALQNGVKNKHSFFLFKVGALRFNRQSLTNLSIRPVLLNSGRHPAARVPTRAKTAWPESVSELYRPSDRRLLAKLVPTFANTGCHVVSVTDRYGRILGFLDRNERKS